jgi:hypothetical protein
MKTIILFFSIIFISQPVFCAIGHPASDSVLLLYAAKEGHLTKYAPDNFLKIFYTTDSGDLKIRGKLVKILKDSIDILPFEKANNIERIAISNITAIEKLHRKWMKELKVFLPILVVLTVVGWLLIESVYGIILLFIPAVSIYVIPIVIIGSILANIFSKKSIAKGWKFYSGNGINKTHHKPAISRYRPLP